MQTQLKSLAGARYFGYCPDVSHPGQEIFLNLAGNFECPQCHLQVRCHVTIDIEHDRGTGEFKGPPHARLSALDVKPFRSGKIEHDWRVEDGF
jgi:hypothetical protein